MTRRDPDRPTLRAAGEVDAETTRARCPLPPFPDGWWVVGLSRDLPPGKLIERRWMGRLIVAWRDHGGTVCVADVYCPHMGARLSPSAGGRISSDRLRCPFHGFEFDASGACVRTPNAPAPSSCRLGTYRVHETAGFVFAYFGTGSRIPDWEPPAVDVDGWTPIKVSRTKVRTHPQDIAENSVDINHLWQVHGWENGRQSSRARTDGRYYTAAFSYTGHPNMPGMSRVPYEAASVVHVWGLGFVYTESDADAFGARVRNWFLASPVDGDYFEAYVAVQVRGAPRRPGRFPALDASIGGLRDRVARWMIAYEAVKEFRKDVAIWNHRRYEASPALVATDGQLHKFRQYCRQFYPALAEERLEDDAAA